MCDIEMKKVKGEILAKNSSISNKHTFGLRFNEKTSSETSTTLDHVVTTSLEFKGATKSALSSICSRNHFILTFPKDGIINNMAGSAPGVFKPMGVLRRVSSKSHIVPESSIPMRRVKFAFNTSELGKISSSSPSRSSKKSNLRPFDKTLNLVSLKTIKKVRFAVLEDGNDHLPVNDVKHDPPILASTHLNGSILKIKSDPVTLPTLDSQKIIAIDYVTLAMYATETGEELSPSERRIMPVNTKVAELKSVKVLTDLPSFEAQSAWAELRAMRKQHLMRKYRKEIYGEKQRKKDLDDGLSEPRTPITQTIGAVPVVQRAESCASGDATSKTVETHQPAATSSIATTTVESNGYEDKSMRENAPSRLKGAEIIVDEAQTRKEKIQKMFLATSRAQKEQQRLRSVSNIDPFNDNEVDAETNSTGETGSNQAKENSMVDAATIRRQRAQNMFLAMSRAQKEQQRLRNLPESAATSNHHASDSSGSCGENKAASESVTE